MLCEIRLVFRPSFQEGKGLNIIDATKPKVEAFKLNGYLAHVCIFRPIIFKHTYVFFDQ